MNQSLETVNILEAVVIKRPKQAHLQTQRVNYDILSGCESFYDVLCGVYKRIYIKKQSTSIRFSSEGKITMRTEQIDFIRVLVISNLSLISMTIYGKL